MKVNEFNWNTKDKEEIRKELETIKYAEDYELEDLGIYNEKERQDYLEELEDMLNRKYDNDDADKQHEDKMLGLI